VLTNVEVYSSWSSAPDLPLTVGVGEDEDPIQIRDIQGLGPVKANIGSTQMAQRGEFFTGSNTPKRNIVMTVGFNPDYVNHTVASLREKLYGYFMPEQPVTLRIFRTNGPAVEIDGYAESCEPNIFAQDPEMQISIICLKPDFIAVSASTVEGAADVDPDEVEFTALANVETPLLLEVLAEEDDATTYDGKITFSRKTLRPTAETFTITGTVAEGITTKIDSTPGDKRVYADYGPEDTNLLNSMTPESVWPRITPGTNKVRVLLEDVAGVPKAWKITYFDRFGGL
jgi:hypothetical protein